MEKDDLWKAQHAENGAFLNDEEPVQGLDERGRWVAIGSDQVRLECHYWSVAALRIGVCTATESGKEEEGCSALCKGCFYSNE